MGRAGQIISPLEINELQIELLARLQRGDGERTMKNPRRATGSRIDEAVATTPLALLTQGGKYAKPVHVR